MKRSFGSDNFSGVHPNIMEALNKVNVGHAKAYGYDEVTENAIKKIKNVFGEDCKPFFVYNGTGANVSVLKAITRSFEAILSPSTSHINVDECGALENLSGSKIIDIPTEEGKITPEIIKPYLQVVGDEHHSQPKVISLTQVTELGTVYTIEELNNITEFAHENNLFVHMDGARLANAAAVLDCSLKEITNDVGIDVLSFGGTKNGLMFGETVIFFNQELAKNYKFYRKQSMQLHSKMRFIAAQFDALLTDELWKKNAKKANDSCKLLVKGIKKFKKLELLYKHESNGVFLKMEKDLVDYLHKYFFFYYWNEEKNEIRLMTSFDTKNADVEKLISLIENFYSGGKN